MKIAFYKKRGTIVDKTIRWWTRPQKWKIFSRSKYSHTEIVFSDGIFFSSSGRDGGVRFKEIEPSQTDWDFIEVPMKSDDEEKVRQFCKLQNGKKYDWRAIFFSQFLELNRENSRRWFCSEICLRALQEVGFFTDEKASEFSPQELYELLLENFQ
jgi:hypothetical protein